ncbi:MAG: hypothetical protein JWR34_190 [Mycobacterium sp.]|nr:hypothetical protein [Mycobacterium sp.]
MREEPFWRELFISVLGGVISVGIAGVIGIIYGVLHVNWSDVIGGTLVGLIILICLSVFTSIAVFLIDRSYKKLTPEEQEKKMRRAWESFRFAWPEAYGIMEGELYKRSLEKDDDDDPAAKE